MFEKPRKQEQTIQGPPERCGVDGCNRKCVVYVKEYNVARCAFHYQLDLNRLGLDSFSQAKKYART